MISWLCEPPLKSFQIETLEFWEKYPQTSLIKFRQGGFTNLATIFALWHCLTRRNIYILFLTNSDREAWQTCAKLKRKIDSLPEESGAYRLKDNYHIQHFERTNSKIHFSSSRLIRPTKCDILIIDEAAFHREINLQSFIGEKIIAYSSPNGTNNWFYQICQSWKTFKPDCHLNYTKEKLEEFKVTLGDRGFRQEILGEFL